MDWVHGGFVSLLGMWLHAVGSCMEWVGSLEWFGSMIDLVPVG